MSQRQVYHVVRGDNDQWQVVKEGFKRPHIARVSKEEAILIAKRLAKTQPVSRVVVHSEDDVVELEFRFEAV